MFDCSDLKYHGEVFIGKGAKVAQRAFKSAINACNEKCNTTFKTKFDKMTSFEVYHYQNGEEKQLFYKEKEV